MTTRQVDVQRISVVCHKPFADVVAAIDREVGHPDIREFSKQLAQGDVEKLVGAAIGPSGFMEFARFDLGAVLRKKIMRLVIGNPLIMRAMVQHVPDAGSYAPVTILIVERPDGVHLSYDRMASLLEPYGNAEALAVARDLDARVEKLFAVATGDRALSSAG